MRVAVCAPKRNCSNFATSCDREIIVRRAHTREINFTAVTSSRLMVLLPSNNSAHALATAGNSVLHLIININDLSLRQERRAV